MILSKSNILLNSTYLRIGVLSIFFASLLPYPVLAQENDSIPSKRNISWRIFPAIASQPETGLQLGAVAAISWSGADTADQAFSRPSSLTPVFIYSLRNQVLGEFNMDLFFGGGKNLNASPRFSVFPDRYFGIGNDTDPEAFESFTHEFFQLEGQLSVPITPSIFWGLYFDVQNSSLRKFEEGGELVSADILGSEGGFLAGVGPAFRYDTRDNVIYPSKGFFINVRSLFSYVGDFAYSNYTFDVRRYFSLRDDRDVLVVQLNATFTSGDEIPFYKLPQLGGSTRLRGLNNASVYRDRQMMLAQIEYRKHIIWRVGAVAFAGMGDVGNSLEDFQLSEMKYAAGAGIRFQILDDQKLNIRFDYGLASNNQSAFYISLREAF